MDSQDKRCPTGVQNATKITALEGRIVAVEGAVVEIRDKLLGRLPNWATLLLTALFSCVTGLVVAMVKK